MSSTLLLPPRAQLCNRSCSNKTHTLLVGRRASGAGVLVIDFRRGSDAMQHTTTPTCFEVLGDLGTDVRRIGRFVCGLWVDALEPGPVGAGGVPLVAVGGDAADVPLGIDHGPKVVPLDSADGDEAESVRARFRERASSPCGEDGDVEPAGHPPGGGVCAALFLSSRCMGLLSFLCFSGSSCAQFTALPS